MPLVILVRDKCRFSAKKMFRMPKERFLIVSYKYAIRSEPDILATDIFTQENGEGRKTPFVPTSCETLERKLT